MRFLLQKNTFGKKYLKPCPVHVKDIQVMIRLFLVIAMYSLSSQFKPVLSITQPLRLLAGWEGT